MLGTVLGWVLVVLGVASYIVALAILIKEQFFKKEERPFPAFQNLDLKTIAEVIEKLSGALENFGKLSVPVQWALLGLANIGIGSYLISAKPF